MTRTLSSARHKRLAELLIRYREEAGLTQAQVARALGRHQPFVSTIEAGQRRVDLVEFLDIAAVLGADPKIIIDQLVLTTELE